MLLPIVSVRPITSFKNFSYLGTGAIQTINVAHDLRNSFIWLKSTSTTKDHTAFDSVRGASKQLFPNATSAESTVSGITAFLATGFTLGSSNASNESGVTFQAFTWKKQALYMDIVTYTGTGVNRTVAHNLGAVPKFMIVKKRSGSSADGWIVYHASNTGAPATDALFLNTTSATVDDNTYWNDTAPDASVFSLGTAVDVNENGSTYVAYLFADKAGYSKTGTYTGNGATNAITGLGFTPKFVLVKRTDSVSDWTISYLDGSTVYTLKANDTAGRTSALMTFDPNGFTLTSSTDVNTNTGTYIYYAAA